MSPAKKVAAKKAATRGTARGVGEPTEGRRAAKTASAKSKVRGAGRAGKKTASGVGEPAGGHRAAKAAVRKPKRRDAGRIVASLNCNGLRSAGRRGFSEWLSNARPDVCLLQEVRAWPEQLDDELLSPPGYNARWVCAEKKGYSGVTTLSRTLDRAHDVGVALPWADEQGRFLRSEFDGLTTLNLYLPSGSSSEEAQERKDAFMDHFLSVAARLLEEQRPMVLCGDFNIAHTELDIHNPKGNAKNSGFLPHERAWFTQLLALGWHDVLRELHPEEPGLYSWWSNRGRARENDKGWRLDYVLASPSLAPRAEEAWIDKAAGLSDHAPVLVRFAD